MRMENNEVCFLGCRGPAFGFEQEVLPFTDRILRKPIGQHLVPARLDSMAGSLNVLRLASHVLIALVRIHDRLIHVRKPLVMFVVHRSMVASTTDISTQSVLCEAANFVLSGHEMVNQLLGASEVETFVRGDMDNEVCECAVRTRPIQCCELGARNRERRERQIVAETKVMIRARTKQEPQVIPGRRCHRHRERKPWWMEESRTEIPDQR
jgi:hypothetical protein